MFDVNICCIAFHKKHLKRQLSELILKEEQIPWKKVLRDGVLVDEILGGVKKYLLGELPNGHSVRWLEIAGQFLPGFLSGQINQDTHPCLLPILIQTTEYMFSAIVASTYKKCTT